MSFLSILFSKHVQYSFMPIFFFPYFARDFAVNLYEHSSQYVQPLSDYNGKFKFLYF